MAGRGLFRHAPQPQLAPAGRFVAALATPSQNLTLPLLDASGGGAIYHDEVVADSPTSYWRLGDASKANGAEASDHQGASHGHYWAVGDVASLQAGDADTACSFVSASISSIYNIDTLPVGSSAGCSVEALVKFSATDATRTIFLWGLNSDTVYYHWLYYQGGYLCWQFTDGTSYHTAVAAFTPTTGVVYHIAVVHDYSTKVIHFYIDGSDTADSSFTGGASPSGVAVNTRAHIGTYNDVSNYFSGTLDEVALYGSVLSPTRVSAHFAAVTGAGGERIYAPTLSLAPYPITVPLLDASSAIYAPTLVGGGGAPQDLTVPLLDAAPALYAPTLTPKSTLTLGLLDAAPALYAPTLTPKSTLTLGLLDATSAIYAPTLTPKTLLTVPFLDATSAIYAPTLTVGPVTLTVPLLDAAPAIYAPTITGAALTLTVPLVASSVWVGEGWMQDDLGEGGWVIFTPTVSGGLLSLTVPFLDATPAIYAVTLVGQNALVVPLIDGAPALYAPTIANAGGTTFYRGIATSSAWGVAAGRQMTYARTIASSSAWTAGTVKTVQKPLATSSAWGASMTKTARVTLAVTSSFAPSVARTVRITLAVASSFTPAQGRSLVVVRAIAVSSSWVADIARSVIVGPGEGSGTSFLERLLHLRK